MSITGVFLSLRASPHFEGQGYKEVSLRILKALEKQVYFIQSLDKRRIFQTFAACRWILVSSTQLRLMLFGVRGLLSF